MLGKDKLVFDASVTLTENDNVGAYVRASDGTLITHTTYGGVEALDFSISNASIIVTATDLDIRDLTHVSDSVKVGDGTDFLAINADGSILGMYAEDSAHASGAIGSFSLAVRNDTPGSLVSADGDYAPLQVDSVGRLRVLADLTAAFDFTYAEDSAHTSGDVGSFSLAVRNSARAALTSTDGDYSAFAVDDAGRILTSAEKAEDAAHASGDYGNFVLGVRNDANATLTSADGDYSPLATDSAGRLKVVFAGPPAYAEDSAHVSADLGFSVLAVAQATLAASVSADGDYGQFKLNARGALWTSPVGTSADDAADSENPIKVGSRAESGALTAVSDGDRADLLSDDFRRVYVNSGANIGVEETAVTVTTTATLLPATALTGRRKIYIQNLSNQEIFLGGSGVTTAGGLRIAAGGVFEDEVGDDVALYAIKAAGTANVRVLELA
jgi:hypothetical protein